MHPFWCESKTIPFSLKFILNTFVEMKFATIEWVADYSIRVINFPHRFHSGTKRCFLSSTRCKRIRKKMFEWNSRLKLLLVGATDVNGIIGAVLIRQDKMYTIIFYTNIFLLIFSRPFPSPKTAVICTWLDTAFFVCFSDLYWANLIIISKSAYQMISLKFFLPNIATVQCDILYCLYNPNCPNR